MDVNVEHQTFENLSNLVQKSFSKASYISGMLLFLINKILLYCTESVIYSF